MRILPMLRIIALLFCSASLQLHGQQATILEERRTIPTYPFSDPDPVPMVARNPALYPYHAFDGFSAKAEGREWTLVQLENDYLKVFVLPGVGGKVFGAVEKSTGHEFLYMNDALKFRRIALRGPWTSGGIEFNFGIIGHTPSTASPVDYLLRRDADGSVTCFVGTMDLPSRTRWTVAISLPRNGAYLETRPFWYNPSPFEQSYYVWTTAAVNAREDLQYFYPGRFMVPHSASSEPSPWPRDSSGRDLSRYRFNRFEGSKSYFVFGEYEHWFGTYAHDLGMGLGHWALYDDMPGRKIWIWSLFRDGALWEELLTDRKGQYSEPQAGRLLSQVDHEFFPPYTGDSWREFWFPVKGIGGLAAASPRAALNVLQSRDSLRIAVCALQPLADELVVRVRDRLLLRDTLRLKPMEVWNRLLTGYEKGSGLQITLGDHLSFGDDERANDIQRPLRSRTVPEGTPEGLYLAGQSHEKQRQYEAAQGKYETCLKNDSNHVRSMVSLARLAMRRGEYESAMRHSRKALDLQRYDPDANYVAGILARTLGMLVDAKETLGWAARSMTYRSNAFCQIAEILLLERRYRLALEYAERALAFNTVNVNASLVQAIAHRKNGDRERAKAVLDRLLAFDPLNHHARYERHLCEGGQRSLDDFTGFIRNEFPHETYLEIAIAYVKLGLPEEAMTVLTLAPPHPMVCVWLGFLVAKTEPHQARVYLDRAVALSPEFVFPFREESIPALQWAIAARPKSWKLRYYLGLLYWGKRRREEALALFNSCGDPDFSTFSLARAMLKGQMKVGGEESDLRSAMKKQPGAWRPSHSLVLYLQRTGRHQEALQVAEEAARNSPGNVVLGMDHATALYNENRYRKCLLVLKELNVLPYEGSWEAHDLFVRAHLALALENMKTGNYAKALENVEESRHYPEHLGTGEPFEPDYRLQDCLSAICHQRLGSRVSARAAADSVRNYTLRHRVAWGSEHAVGILALAAEGDTLLARSLLGEWERAAPEDVMLQWLRSRVSGEEEREKLLRRQLETDPRNRLRMEVIEACRAQRAR